MTSKDKFDEISSTERLLDVIRSRVDEVGNKPSQQKGPPPPNKGNKLTFLKAREKSASNSVNVGIDIGHKNVNLVKAARSGQKWEILEYKSIPCPADIEKGSNEFTDFLKSEVAPFCSGAKKIETWAIMSSAEVEVRLIRIPKASGKHLEAAIYWTLKKEITINEKDFFFDYEVRGEVSDSAGKKLDVMCYSAPISEVEGTRKLFSLMGVPLSGLSTVPFAVQNIFINNVMTLPEEQAACLFIGNSYSRIDLYTGKKLTSTRDIKTGIKSMIELLMEELNSRTGEIGQEGKIELDEARKILLAFAGSSNNPLILDNGFTVERADVERIIGPVLERLVRQIERTFEHFVSTMGHDRVEKIYVSSVMPVNEAIVNYLGAQLGIECGMFDPLEQALQTSGIDERVSFIPAFGMAFSDNAYTPNFIYSYKDKKRTAYVAKFNRALLTGLIVSVFACSVAIAYEWQSAAQKKAELARLEQQQQKNAPLVNRETLSQLLSAAGQKQNKFAELSKRYRGMALIGELSSLTPETVSLTGLKADFAEKAGEAGSGKAERTTVVEGVISGKQDMLEGMLASYVMKLRVSPMFSAVNVSTSKIESSKQGASLTFALNLKVGPGK